MKKLENSSEKLEEKRKVIAAAGEDPMVEEGEQGVIGSLERSHSSGEKTEKTEEVGGMAARRV